MAAVELFEAFPDHLPGTMFFRCERLGATIRPDDCAARYRRAQHDAIHGHKISCSRCPIGAQHAGGAPRRATSTSCSRCGRQATRLIGRRLCASCYNRQREAKKGRNGRGTVPVKFKPLRPRRVGMLVDGEPRWRLIDGCQTEREASAVQLREGVEAGVLGWHVEMGAKPAPTTPTPAPVELHGDQPGRIVWLPRSRRFAYQSRGQLLAADQDEGGWLTYRPMRRGETPAPVMPPTFVAGVHWLATWLGEPVADARELGEAWRSTAFVCRGCRGGMLEARRRGSRIECRCPACGDSSAG